MQQLPHYGASYPISHALLRGSLSNAEPLLQKQAMRHSPMIIAQAVKSPISFFRVTLSLLEASLSFSLALFPIASALWIFLPSASVRFRYTESHSDLPFALATTLITEEDVRMRTTSRRPPCFRWADGRKVMLFNMKLEKWTDRLFNWSKWIQIQNLWYVAAESDGSKLWNKQYTASIYCILSICTQLGTAIKGPHFYCSQNGEKVLHWILIAFLKILLNLVSQ